MIRWNRDTRPKQGLWAPGDYLCHCIDCGAEFLGDKRAINCADCGYAVEPETVWMTQQEGAKHG